MNTIQKFKELNGKEVARATLEKLITQAKKENATEVVYRVSKILNDNPKHTSFNITVRHYATGLNAPKHSGAYKEALTSCGRLRKGWRFIKGRIVKAQPKVPKTTRKGLAAPKRKEGLTISGRLKKGYKYAKGGSVVKTISKKKVVA